MNKHFKYVLLSLVSATFLVSCSYKNSADVSLESKRQKQAKAAKINVQLGLSYFKQGDVQRAKKKLLLANNQNPNSIDVAGALGFYFERTGNSEQAKAYYKRAISLSKSSGAQLNNFGAFLCRESKYKLANQYFERAAADLNYVNSAGALENAGLCSLAIPNITLAESYFKKAFEQDPKRLKSVYELTKIAFDKKQYKKALQWVEQYQSLNPLEPSVSLLAYKAALKAGLKQKADSFAWLLKNRFPQSFEYKQLIESSDNDRRASSIG